MSDIVSKMKLIEDLGVMEGCTEEQVAEAQQALGLTFPPEYVAYVREFGCIDFWGTEWTGLNVGGMFNTVAATLQERELNPDFPANMFVLENLYIDSKVAAVDEAGKVYLVQYSSCSELCDSISAYLELCVDRKDKSVTSF